jgi:hypothetical protein
MIAISPAGQIFSMGGESVIEETISQEASNRLGKGEIESTTGVLERDFLLPFCRVS